MGKLQGSVVSLSLSWQPQPTSKQTNTVAHNSLAAASFLLSLAPHSPPNFVKRKERKGKERKGRRRTTITTTTITSRKRGRELLLFLLLSSTSRKGDISGARSWEASSASSASSLANKKSAAILFYLVWSKYPAAIFIFSLGFALLFLFWVFSLVCW